MKKIHLVHFGDSEVGPFGVVVRALAKGKKKAVQRAAQILSGEFKVSISDLLDDGFSIGADIWEDPVTGESIRVYITPINIDESELEYGGTED